MIKGLRSPSVSLEDCTELNEIVYEIPDVVNIQLEKASPHLESLKGVVGVSVQVIETGLLSPGNEVSHPHSPRTA